jgi:hypothetical protein
VSSYSALIFIAENPRRPCSECAFCSSILDRSLPAVTAACKVHALQHAPRHRPARHRCTRRAPRGTGAHDAPRAPKCVLFVDPPHIGPRHS